MKLSWILVVLLVLSAYFDAPVRAKRLLLLRPMTSSEVYKVLHEAGREDAIPEGRIITQGIAAATGFGLGILKGIGGSVLFDLATSEQTQQYLADMLSSMDTWNFSIPAFGNFGSSSSSSSSSVTATATNGLQEICFNSRSLNEIDDEYDDNESNEAAGRQIATGTTEEAETEPVAEGRRNVGATTSPNLFNTDLTKTQTPAFVVSPALRLPTFGTSSSQKSSRAINCIVINNAVARKRRRRSVKKLVKRMRRSKEYAASSERNKK